MANLHGESQFDRNFCDTKVIGRGGFGKVVEAKHILDERVYAVKIIHLRDSEDVQEKRLREIKALAKLDHPHIVRYYNSWIEYYPRNTLASDKSSTSTGGEKKSVVLDLIRLVMKSSSSSGNYRNEGATAPVRLVMKSRSSSSSGNYRNEGATAPVCDSVSLELSDSNPALSACLFIQMELCQEKTLVDWLRDNTINRKLNFMRFKIFNMFEQIVQAVNYIHNHDLIHRDLKPANILFSHNGHIKVGDFGLVTSMIKSGPIEDERSASAERSHTSVVGTYLYMSPELRECECTFTEGKYNFKVDIYSLGVILFEMLLPFDTDMERFEVLRNLNEMTFPDGFHSQFTREFELLKEMLSHDPKDRPTTTDIIPRLHILSYQDRPTPSPGRKSISKSLE